MIPSRWGLEGIKRQGEKSTGAEINSNLRSVEVWPLFFPSKKPGGDLQNGSHGTGCALTQLALPPAPLAIWIELRKIENSTAGRKGAGCTKGPCC